jgi:hypothetical protein
MQVHTQWTHSDVLSQLATTPEWSFKIGDWQNAKRQWNSDRRAIYNATRCIDARSGVILHWCVSDCSDRARPLWRSHSARTESFFPHATQIYPQLPLEMFDTAIRAEPPSAEENPSLRTNVLKYNMHHSDHLVYPTNCCYNDGQCLYGFPKPLQQTTTMDESGRVVYRWRQEEDRVVVSYMQLLMELNDCNVNVDVMFTVNIFMYLHKYCFKRADNARYTITNPNQ